MLINLKNATIVLFAHRNIKRGIEKKCHKMPKLLAALWFCVQIFHVLTLVSFSSLRRLLSSISTGDRDRYFSRSAGDTELRCKYIFNIKFRNDKDSLHSFLDITNRSSDEGPPNGTLMSSLCKSCGTLSNACGPPCGRPIGPANEPNDPASVGIGCGVNGICWACICCCGNFGKTKKTQINWMNNKN